MSTPDGEHRSERNEPLDTASLASEAINTTTNGNLLSGWLGSHQDGGYVPHSRTQPSSGSAAAVRARSAYGRPPAVRERQRPPDHFAARACTSAVVIGRHP